MSSFEIAAERPSAKICSVSQITALLKDVVEGSFPNVWIAGEISNFSRPQSGHCYFTLKDEGAQLRAVLWRSAAARVRFELEDGLEVLCRGGLELYAPRGTYQLVIEQIQPKGMGALELALRRLREKLAAEGLFDPDRKRPLPRFPRCLALVTSPTGAAVRDFLEVLRRRWPGVDVLIVPTRVQGEGAGIEVAAAIAAVNRLRAPVDCLVLARGGGSLEDLWTFNEEIVVRAVAGSRIPTVSAIGHEIDVTLCDLAADVRALTPSEAAERVAPSLEEMQVHLARLSSQLLAGLRGKAMRARLRLDAIADRRAFQTPLSGVHDLARRLDELQLRGQRAVQRQLERSRSLANVAAGKLASLSPLAVLSRGYSLTQRLADGRLVRSAAELNVGDELLTRFAAGEVVSRVDRLTKPGLAE